MFSYSYFDFILESNVELTNFNRVFDNSCVKQDKIYINYIYGTPKDYEKNSVDAYISYEDVIFHIPNNQYVINIISESKLAFQEVLRNKPFGVLCYLLNRTVLHASSIEHRGEIYAFCGPKGMGKTTLSFLLSQKYRLFSDDQLCIRNQADDLFLCYSPDNIQKLTSATLKLFGLPEKCESLHPVYNKFMYYSPNISSKNGCPLKAIFILRREEHNLPIYVEKINNHSHKIAQILNNTLGKDQLLRMGYATSDIVNNLAKTDMYYLHYSNFSCDIDKHLKELEKTIDLI